MTASHWIEEIMTPDPPFHVHIFRFDPELDDFVPHMTSVNAYHDLDQARQRCVELDRQFEARNLPCIAMVDSV